MNKFWGAAAMAALAVLSGCASGPPFIDQAQPEALAISAASAPES